MTIVASFLPFDFFCHVFKKVIYLLMIRGCGY